MTARGHGVGPVVVTDTAPLLRAVKAARRKRDRADADLRSYILFAREAGATLQSIADAASVSRQRIHDMLREER